MLSSYFDIWEGVINSSTWWAVCCTRLVTLQPVLNKLANVYSPVPLEAGGRVGEPPHQSANDHPAHVTHTHTIHRATPLHTHTSGLSPEKGGGGPGRCNNPPSLSLSCMRSLICSCWWWANSCLINSVWCCSRTSINDFLTSSLFLLISLSSSFLWILSSSNAVNQRCPIINSISPGVANRGPISHSLFK